MITSHDTPAVARRLSTDMEKKFVKIAFVLLIPLLCLQIPLRYLYDLEPYPSLLLPGGASIIKDDGFITFAQTKLVAVSASGASYEVSIRELLSTVPAQYRQPIVQRSFGLPSSKHDHRESNSDDAIAKGRKWLRNRLGVIAGERELVKLNIGTYRVRKPTTDLSYAAEMTMVGVVEVPLH